MLNKYQNDLNNARKKAEHLRQIVEQSRPEQLLVTMSFGVVQLDQKKDNIDDMIKRADEALYVAKEPSPCEVPM